MSYVIAVVVRIGFESSKLVVGEKVGMQQVCVRVFAPNGMTELPPDINIFATVRTVPGTAGILIMVSCMVMIHTIIILKTDETDYGHLSPGVDVVLMFSNATRRECFNVEIINDMLIEGEERFSLVLMEDPSFPSPIDTEFFPNMVNITITAQNGKFHGKSIPGTRCQSLINIQRL